MGKELNNIRDLLLKKCAVDIFKYDETFLLKSLKSRLISSACVSYGEYYNYLKLNNIEANTFINSLNISYSEFFRNPLTFNYLEQVILPSLIHRKERNKEREIRIWSTACASGQEAYSLAILCDELTEITGTSLTFRIFASDISREEIAKAQIGSFNAASLNNVTLKRITSNFSKISDSYTITPRLKENIDFSVFDLLSAKGGCPPASVYGNFDLVFCSNLLFYYKQEYWHRIISNLGGCLAGNGYLITGETEREILKECHYREVFDNTGIFTK